MSPACHHELSKIWPMLATSLPVAQWLEEEEEEPLLIYTAQGSPFSVGL